MKIYRHPAFELVGVSLSYVKGGRLVVEPLDFKNKAKRELYTLYFIGEKVSEIYDDFLETCRRHKPKRVTLSIVESTYFDPGFKLHWLDSHLKYEVSEAPKRLDALLEEFYSKTKVAQDVIYRTKDVKSFIFSMSSYFPLGTDHVEFSLRTKFRRTFPYV